MSANDTEPFPNYPGVDGGSCSLLGPTALVVQGLMGVLVILSLVFKRHRETPKRPWRIWLFDVSKQVFGQMFVHGVNVVVSNLVAHRSSGNACVLYFLNILIDTTLGVAIIYLILRLITHLLTERFCLKGFESGQYGIPPSIKYWARQAAVYVLALTTMKLLVVGLLALFPRLLKIGGWLLSWTRTGDNDYFQIIFTMGIFPITMNVLQFWLIDSIVKASSEPSLSLPTVSHGDSYEDREPLFRASEDDDDDAYTSRRDIENPRLLKQSHDSSDTISSNTLGEEQKGSGSSKSSSPIDMEPSAAITHAYPPSVTSSPSSPNISTRKSLSPKPVLTRKTKPPPLNIRANSQPAVNSPQPSNPPLKQQEARPPKKPQDDWASTWEDSEDWADRVGEEDWTGRRIEEKKGTVSDVWVDHNLASARS